MCWYHCPAIDMKENKEMSKVNSESKNYIPKQNENMNLRFLAIKFTYITDRT